MARTKAQPSTMNSPPRGMSCARADSFASAQPDTPASTQPKICAEHGSVRHACGVSESTATRHHMPLQTAMCALLVEARVSRWVAGVHGQRTRKQMLMVTITVLVVLTQHRAHALGCGACDGRRASGVLSRLSAP